MLASKTRLFFMMFSREEKKGRIVSVHPHLAKRRMAISKGQIAADIAGRPGPAKAGFRLSVRPQRRRLTSAAVQFLKARRPIETYNWRGRGHKCRSHNNKCTPVSNVSDVVGLTKLLRWTSHFLNVGWP